jgi:hypothetical protein
MQGSKSEGEFKESTEVVNLFAVGNKEEKAYIEGFKKALQCCGTAHRASVDIL